jgi:hypothetical protein
MSSFLTKPSLSLKNSQEPNLISFWQPGGMLTSGKWCEEEKGVGGIYRGGVLPTLQKSSERSLTLAYVQCYLPSGYKGVVYVQVLTKGFYKK